MWAAQNKQRGRQFDVPALEVGKLELNELAAPAFVYPPLLRIRVFKLVFFARDHILQFYEHKNQTLQSFTIKTI